MFFVTTENDGAWEMPDALRAPVVAFLNSLVVACPDAKHHVTDHASTEIVFPSVLVVGVNRIALIKHIRQYYGISLKEAKDTSEEMTPIKLGGLPYYKALELQRDAASTGSTIQLPNALDRLAKI